MAYSIETLEFGLLLEQFASLAQTPMGRSLILASRPMSGRRELDRAINCVSEAISLREEKQVSWSFSGLEDPSESISLLRVSDSILAAAEIAAISRVARQAMFARSAIMPESDAAPALAEIVEALPATLLATVERIDRKLLPGGEIDDSASPELARIRSEINSKRGRITRSLESAMRAAGTAIQDEIVTVRNDRYVIPVKTDLRGKVTGVAHGFSSSGQTVYVEPLETIEANNELQNLKGKEEREIARILAGMTDELRGLLPAIVDAASAIAELDAIGAKAEFTRRRSAVLPEISDDGDLELVDARHPLLETNLKAAGSEEIVPSSFGLSKERSAMIISGANAGGKTVVLKTAGLLALMAISGLPVTARSAKVPFFRSILADIGDHQSLSANLSTFSSHMSNIASMMNECDPPALILLDEAGTGTDPEEGSALGVAIVDHFRRLGAHVIASTHYRGLKIYAANDPSVINASVEFDERTLRPTYRLMVGIAGSSSGIEIAHRFGLPDEVIAAARDNLDVSAQETEDYLKRLQNETRIVSDLRTALEEEREAVAVKFASLESDAEKNERRRKREFENALAQALDDVDRQAKAFISTIDDKILKNRLEKERLERKSRLNSAVMRHIGGTDGKQNAPSERVDISKVVEVGSRVITPLGKAGIVEKIDRGYAEVLVGNIRLREKISNLAVSIESAREKGKRRQPPPSIDSSEAAAELNLIGYTTADAEYELDRFIDEAYMSQMPRVRIIHGFGTGALKNYVHHFLKSSDLVERFEFATPDKGGHGATIAEIKL